MSPNRHPFPFLVTAFVLITAVTAYSLQCDELYVDLNGTSGNYRTQRAIGQFEYPKDRPAKVIVYAGYDWVDRGTEAILKRVSAEAQARGRGRLEIEIVDTTKLTPAEVKKNIDDHLSQVDAIVFFAHANPGLAALHDNGLSITGNRPGPDDIDVRDQKWTDKTVVFLGCNTASCVYTGREGRVPPAQRLADTTMRHTGARQVIGSTRVGNERDQLPLFRALFAAEHPVAIEGYRSLTRTQGAPEPGDTVAEMNALKSGGDADKVRFLNKLVDWVGLGYPLPENTDAYVANCLRSGAEKPELAAAAFRYLVRRPLLSTLLLEIKKMKPAERYALFDSIVDRTMTENRNVPALNTPQKFPEIFLTMVEDNPARFEQLIKYYLEVNPTALLVLKIEDALLPRGPRVPLATREQALKKLASENNLPPLTANVLQGMSLLVDGEPGRMQELVRRFPADQRVQYLLQLNNPNDENPVLKLAKSEPANWGNHAYYVRLLLAIRRDPALAGRGESLGTTARQVVSGKALASLPELTQLDTDDRAGLSQWLRRFAF